MNYSEILKTLEIVSEILMFIKTKLDIKMIQVKVTYGYKTIITVKKI